MWGSKELKQKNEELTRLLAEEKQNVLAAKGEIDAIVEGIIEGLFVVNKKGKIILFNSAAQKITGLKRAQVINKKYSSVLQFIKERNKKDVVDDIISKVIKSGKVKKGDENYYLVSKDKRAAITFSAAPILCGKKKDLACVLVLFRDVTKKVTAEKKKSEFIAIVSHQLRTPLTAIRWGVESMRQSADSKLTPKQLGYLSDVEGSTKRMIKLVTGLLNVSRIESGQLKVTPIKIDFVKFVSTIIRELRPIAAAKNIKIVYRKPKSKIAQIALDKDLIYQVVHNILTNAIRYSKASGTIYVSLEKKEKNALLMAIKDSGIGIPQKSQNRVFEKFFRADNATTSATDGSGLGLYFAKMIVIQSGGEIWFESEEDKGTTFYVKLPMRGMKAKKGTKSFVKS